MGYACVLEANSRALERGLSLVHANKPHINLRIAPGMDMHCVRCVLHDNIGISMRGAI